MKNVFARIFFLFCGLLPLQAAAQNITPDLAQRLHDRAMAIHSKIEEAKASTPGFAKSQLNSGEVKVVDEILPRIEKLLIEAADLFTLAAEKLPSWEGKDCLKQGCSRLKDAQELVREARKLLRMDGVLHTYGEMLDEIKQDIKDSLEDAGCKRIEHHSNPWNGKNFKSEYSNPQGQWVSGRTQIDGNKGSYSTDGGQRGSFHSVSYRDDGKTAQGYWRFQNGANGWFTFTLNGDQRSFYGSWGEGDRIGQNQKGSWKGNIN